MQTKGEGSKNPRDFADVKYLSPLIAEYQKIVFFEPRAEIIRSIWIIFNQNMITWLTVISICIHHFAKLQHLRMLFQRFVHQSERGRWQFSRWCPWWGPWSCGPRWRFGAQWRFSIHKIELEVDLKLSMYFAGWVWAQWVSGTEHFWPSVYF